MGKKSFVATFVKQNSLYFTYPSVASSKRVNIYWVLSLCRFFLYTMC